MSSSANDNSYCGQSSTPVFPRSSAPLTYRRGLSKDLRGCNSVHSLLTILPPQTTMHSQLQTPSAMHNVMLLCVASTLVPCSLGQVVPNSTAINSTRATNAQTVATSGFVSGRALPLPADAMATCKAAFAPFSAHNPRCAKIFWERHDPGVHAHGWMGAGHMGHKRVVQDS